MSVQIENPRWQLSAVGSVHRREPGHRIASLAQRHDPTMPPRQEWPAGTMVLARISSQASQPFPLGWSAAVGAATAEDTGVRPVEPSRTSPSRSTLEVAGVRRPSARCRSSEGGCCVSETSFAYSQCMCDLERKLSSVHRALGTPSTSGSTCCRYLSSSMGTQRGVHGSDAEATR